MPEAIRTQLEEDVQCDYLLDCFHGLTELDRACFEQLVTSPEALTVDDLAERVDRDRTTAYRSVQRLLEAELVEQRQVSGDGSSYHHVYEPRDPDAVADQMQRELNDYYAKMGQLIHEFRDKFGERTE
ncbi:helix-turn-helix domain-containing protein [Haloarcula onubensis]|uniref:MarR family transcriptional regulator n=1 Tax=Haloarcula onubensis TaxID=2950539 RepID=A0ABU2FLM6_9EURY|nr:helix-turn-helix domain-containing protein [Halomicroarcula sp. S3CR25-11]MDS0281668.1 MarR family transcriptional regulator [Halomicroarcula sp. S3CR25-11]